MPRLKYHPNVLVEKYTVDTNGSDKQDSNYSVISVYLVIKRVYQKLSESQTKAGNQEFKCLHVI